MKWYEYMVIYSGQNLTGRMCVTRNNPIETYGDVEGVDSFIGKHKEAENLGNIFVIDFKLLRTYEDSEVNVEISTTKL